MPKVDRWERKVNAPTDEAPALRPEARTPFEAVLRELQAQRRDIRGWLYGPVLERYVRSALPGYARRCLTPILQYKPRPEILHYGRTDNLDCTQRFQEEWWDGDYPDSAKENPLLADIVFCLHPVAKEGRISALVCEIAAHTDADEVEQAYQRGQWLDLHSPRDLCVIPLVVGEQWESSAVEAAAQYQIPCLGVRLHADNPGENGIESWEPQADFLKRLAYWVAHAPSFPDR